MSDNQDTVNQLWERIQLTFARLNKEEIEKFLDSLPRLSEQDLIELGHGDKDATCPVCITPTSAIVAEEEMALAMESPAHASEELGMTRLWIESREDGQKGCGHLFCRRCISKWVGGGHDSCPTCRSLIIPRSAESDSTDSVDGDFDVMVALRDLEQQMQELTRRTELLDELTRGDSERETERVVISADEDERNNSEYSGMYS